MSKENNKLTKVLEHLVKGEEDLARDLLHQVFIDKARAIHEELMNNDEATHEEEMEEGLKVTVENTDEDGVVGGSGDQGKDLTNEIKALEDEIDFEETMSEDDGEEEVDAEVEMPMDGGDDVEAIDTEVVDEPSDDMPMDDTSGEEVEGTVQSVEKKMGDLEAALADLKAEFEALEANEGGDEGGEMPVDGGEEMPMPMDGGEEGDDDDGEEKTDESWTLDEDFDDLAESLDLEVVVKDNLAVKPAAEVGSGKSGMSDGNSAKSPVPKSQTDRMGAKPVDMTKGGTANGFKLETAPKSGDINIGNSNKDNRRKKATDGTKKMSKEGDASAALNKTASEFGIGSTGKMSPLSKGGNNLK